jgi:uncharacterized protein (TIGR03437 family)
MQADQLISKAAQSAALLVFLAGFAVALPGGAVPPLCTSSACLCTSLSSACADLNGIWNFKAQTCPNIPISCVLDTSGTVQIIQGSSLLLSGVFLVNGVMAVSFAGSVYPAGAGASYYLADLDVGGNSYSSGIIAQDGMSVYHQNADGAIIWEATRLSGVGAPKITSVTNAASGTLGSIAPGEVISIYAAYAGIYPIGPATGVNLQLDQNGKVATSLGGVQVVFLPTGVTAPLIYVSAGQINAVVPYEIAGLSGVTLQTQYQNQASNTIPLQVRATAPAIFTIGGSGSGQGAILNHDGTVNGPSSPEPRGGIVVLFMTGEGQTAPPGVSGKVTTESLTPPLTPQPVASPVVATINNQPASVLFYGEAPDLVSGVMQVNIRVPLNISPGTVPISLSVGGESSQSAATVVSVSVE